ncbi:MAG: hypothetical protein J3K34DRAFT_521406 [Monoraphidium minutum]|nr:MAG: hypothetical protein J3K34DRAFT_521406 [Monoraphidium minutum]
MLITDSVRELLADTQYLLSAPESQTADVRVLLGLRRPLSEKAPANGLVSSPPERKRASPLASGPLSSASPLTGSMRRGGSDSPRTTVMAARAWRGAEGTRGSAAPAGGTRSSVGAAPTGQPAASFWDQNSRGCGGGGGGSTCTPTTPGNASQWAAESASALAPDQPAARQQQRAAGGGGGGAGAAAAAAAAAAPGAPTPGEWIRRRRQVPAAQREGTIAHCWAQAAAKAAYRRG